ncbi:MAG: anti-sigma factor, partial [Planctomycetota bacterium]
MSDTDMNTPCDFEAELPLLLYQGELVREERERLKSHLATCARCVEALAQLESTAIALDGAMAVPKPSEEQWKKLKSNVLARVAAPATAAPTTSADGTPADEACEAIEEDLLVLGEVGADRRKQVAAHIDKCASCRDTRSAFGSIGLVLNREPLVWPSIERWDSLKETVLSTIDGEVKRAKDSARAKQVIALPVTRSSFRGFARAAAAVILLVGVAGAATFLRGPSADEVRRLYREAQGGGTLAVVTRNYELVVKQGIDKPECRSEVDDALLQLQAIHHFENAMSQPNRDLKVVLIREGIAKWPGAQVTQLAL